MHGPPVVEVKEKPSLSALAAHLCCFAPGVTTTGDDRSLDELLDDFIEEHSLCYEFREASARQDRYDLVFHALQKELCCITWPPQSISCARALRVLQCLRLLTRDPDHQLVFFEGTSPSSGPREQVPKRDCDRNHESERELDVREREPMSARGEQQRDRERGRDQRPSLLPPPAPATSSTTRIHPLVPGGSRPGLSASPRRSKWRSPDGRGVAPRRHNSVGDDHFHTLAEDTSEDAERGVRLPPLETLKSPRRTSGSVCRCPASASDGTTPSTAALLRLLTELVKYLAVAAGGDDTHSMHAADVSAGSGMDARLGVAVAGVCVTEIVSIVNRYATTEQRRSRLAQLGALRPLTNLLSGATDMVLRCALEALVHFTTNRNAVVLGELSALALENRNAASHALNGYSAGLLRSCLSLLACGEDLHEVLAAQLLDHLLEVPDLRLQFRRINAVPAMLSCLRIDSPDCTRGFSRFSSEGALGGTHAAQKTIRVLRCCQKLARDHVELGDQMAVQELREHDALGAILTLLKHCQRGQEEAGTLTAAMDTLAQMCMDDECATALRSHGEGIATIGSLLLNQSRDQAEAPQEVGATLRGAGKGVAESPSPTLVQCSAARLLRFLFAVERNRKAFKHIFSADLFGLFIDVGNYIWALDAYVPFVSALNGLTEKEVGQIHSNFLRSFARGMMMQRGKVGKNEAAAGGVSSSTAFRAGLSDSSVPGRTVCGYQLLECVGAGAFGRVHLAHWPGLASNFALKEVPLSPLSDSVAGPPAPQPRPPAASRAARRPSSRCSTPRGSRGSTPSRASPELAAAAPSRASPELAAAEASAALNNSEGAAQDQVARDICQEVQLLRQLDHPNIVRYYSSFTTGSDADSTLWIVMEFCNGASLQSFTASKREKGFARLPEDQTWQIFVQLCLALRYLHIEKQIAHRDLTPNNVLVQAHTLATKIADFGLAKQKAGGRGTACASMMQSMVGTILYSSPEIVQHKPYTHKTDVWALGCLMYKMATLTDPFQGSNPLTVAKKIVECDYNKLDLCEYSEMLIDTCSRCLTVIPEERPDIQQVCQLITPALLHHLEHVQRAIVNQHPRELDLPTRTASPDVIEQEWELADAAHGQMAPHGTAPSTQPETSTCQSVHDEAASPPLPPRHHNSWRDSLPGSAHSCLSNVSAVSHHSAQSVQTALSVQTAQTAYSVNSFESEKSARSHSLEPVSGTVCVPRHLLGTVVDPLQKALLISHQLAFVGQIRHQEVDESSPLSSKRLAVDQYQRWLFSTAQGALVMKREISRLMQRSQDLVECRGPNGEAPSDHLASEVCAVSQLTYEVLLGHISDVCAAHGYYAE